MSTSEIKKIFPSFEEGLLAEIEKDGQARTIEAGETILRTGQYFRSTLLILNGLIKVYREDEQGNEFLMYYLKPGDACALSMVCSNQAHSSEVMAKAVQPTEILTIPLQQMDEWMTRYKSWYHFVIETYRSRFEELLVTIDHVAFRAMDERLEFYLKKCRDAEKVSFLEISHQQVADELNSSREVISRLLKKMEQMGKVKLHRNAIEIVSL